MDLGTRALSATAVSLERTIKYYDVIRPHTDLYGKYAIELRELSFSRTEQPRS